MPTRLLVIKLSSLGDLFHALPAVHCLKQAWNASIDWLTHDAYTDLVGCFSDVDEVLGFPRRDILRRLAPAFRALRARRYDLVLDMQGLLKSAVLARTAKGARRIGPSFWREGARTFYDEVAGPPDCERHAVDQILDVVRYLDVPLAPIRFPIAAPLYDTDRARPRVALVPLSRWPTKNWPWERFADVGCRLHERAGASVFVVGGPDHTDTCRRIARSVPEAVYPGPLPLPALAGLLKAMDLVLSVDTGPMHLAAALGRPVLAVFGATDPVRTGPYGAGHQVITVEDLSCRPCRARTCRRNDLACLHRLCSERVAERALSML
jgi:lipopolysaccharide heptosyltransferase I